MPGALPLGSRSRCTFAGPDPFVDDPAIDRMIAAVDVFSVNHYCLAPSLEVEPIDVATERIDALGDRSGDLPVVFQEFGCPAGEANGSSDADQREWFETAFAHVDSIEQVRAAFVFEFLDWSESTLELAYGSVLPVLEDEVGADFVERFRSWLLTSGLVRADGTTRPAYDLFLEEAGSSVGAWRLLHQDDRSTTRAGCATLAAWTGLMRSSSLPQRSWGHRWSWLSTGRGRTVCRQWSR